MRVAFYAPMIDFSRPRPSGDRRMADLLCRALEGAGYQVSRDCNLRTYHATPNKNALATLKQSAATEIDRLRLLYRDPDQRPDLWLSYHPYYKSPDLIGPRLARELGFPYVTAECTFAGKRSKDAWADWQGASLEAIKIAACHLTFTNRDRDGLRAAGVADDHMADLPPFIDTQAFVALRARSSEETAATTHIATLAMMRRGRKCDSYLHLARGLHEMRDLPWHLTLYGDGPERAAVEAAFSAFSRSKITFVGQIARDQVAQALAGHDLYAWPGIGEAYGLAYLEAQAAGLPVVAYDSGGVSACVQDGITGLLTTENDVTAFALAIKRLTQNHNERYAMGQAARHFVLEQRNLPGTAQRLKIILSKVIKA